LPKGHTTRRIFTLDGSNDADSRKDLALSRLVDIAPNLDIKFPKTLNRCE